MYSWKVTTFTEKDLFSTQPQTDTGIWKDKKLKRRKGKENSPAAATSSNDQEISCSVCKKLREELEKHLKSHHRENCEVPPAERVANSSSAPKTPKPRNTSSPWTEKTTIGDQKDKKREAEEKATRAAEQVGKSGKSSKGDKTDKPKRRQEPKMKQLTIFNMLDSLEKSKGSAREFQKPMTGKEDNQVTEDSNQKAFQSRDKRVTEKENKLPEEMKSTPKPSISRQKLQLTPQTVPGELEKSYFSSVMKDNETKPNGEVSKPQPTPERDWKPFKQEKYEFVPVVDTFGQYPCLWCKKKFARPFSLTRHMSKHKDQKNKQWFSCKECGKKFDRKDGLKRHHLSHKNERPHVCCTCRTRFKQKSHLNQHLKLDRCFKRLSSARY